MSDKDRSLVDWTEPQTREEWVANVAEFEDRLPVITNVDGLVAWFRERAELITVDEIETGGARVGRNDYPWLVFQLYLFKLLQGSALSYAVSDAWSSAEMPLECFGQNDWRELFDAAGYTVDGVVADRPRTPIRLYRGCRPSHRRRWSWSTDPLVAHWFASRPHIQGAVFEVDAPPEAVLASFTADSESFRNEAEVIVLIKGLRIREHVCGCDRG